MRIQTKLDDSDVLFYANEMVASDSSLHTVSNTVYSNNTVYSTNNSLLVQGEISPNRLVAQYPDTMQVAHRLCELGVLTVDRVEQIRKCQHKELMYAVCGGCGSTNQLHIGGCGARICSFCAKRTRWRTFNNNKETFKELGNLRFLTLGFKNVDSTTLYEREQYTYKSSRKVDGKKIKFDKTAERNKYLNMCVEQFEELRRLLKVEGLEFGTFLRVLEVKRHKFLVSAPTLTREKIRKYHRENGLVCGFNEKNKTVKLPDKAMLDLLQSLEPIADIEEIDEWNCHYHILFDGDYMPIRKITELFGKATKGESTYAYIEKVKDEGFKGEVLTPENIALRRNRALNYVLKYLGKIDGLTDVEELAQFYKATENVKFFTRGIKKRDYKPKVDLVRTCGECGSQHFIYTMNPNAPEIQPYGGEIERRVKSQMKEYCMPDNRMDHTEQSIGLPEVFSEDQAVDLYGGARFARLREAGKIEWVSDGMYRMCS